MAKRKSKQGKGASKKAKTSNPGTGEVVGEELRSERESICEMAKKAKKAKNHNQARKEVVVEELSLENESSSGFEHEEMEASSKESGPNPPLEFFFDSSQYTTICKIQTRCHVYNTVQFLRQAEYAAELQWFTSHPQFCHIFHMPEEKSRKLMGLWMLILRTVVTEEKTMKWFVVNGTPIRYSLREHALISGLDCNEYPTNMNKLGSKRFKEKHFKKVKVITCATVKAKLENMRESEERLKMAVLYFLCTVIRGLSKSDGPIDPFILRLVDDLEVCREFPWGRLTFDDTVKEINHVNSLMKGTANPTMTFPGFIIPLEFLAFECIPKLTKAFRVPEKHEEGCPRMCRWKFTKGMRGYPLEDVYHAVGDTKEIQSILVPTLEEELMMARIISEEPDDEFGEGISSTWNEYLSIQQKKIWWEELYNEDLANREFPEKAEAVEVEEESVPNVEALKEIEERITLMVQNENQELKMRLESMEKEFFKMKKTQRYLKKKIKKLEKEQMKEKAPLAPLNSSYGSEEQMDNDWGGGSYEPKECEKNEVDDVKESGEKEEEEKKDEEEEEKSVEEEKDEEVEEKKDEEEEEKKVEEEEEKKVEEEEKDEEMEDKEEEEKTKEEKEEEEEEEEEKEAEEEEEEDDVVVLTNRNLKERLKDPSDTLRKRNKTRSSKLKLWRLNNLSKKDQTFNEPLFIGFSDVLRSLFEKDYVASKPHLAKLETFPAPVSNFKIRSLIPDDTDPDSAVQQTEEEKVYDPNSWALVPYVEKEEGEQAVPFVEEGEQADPPKKKRGRPKKNEDKSKPKLKTKTPKPKRKKEKSQWVKTPFTEGARKKKKT